MKKKIFKVNRIFRFKRFERKAYSAFNSMHKTVSIGVLTAGILTLAAHTETSAQTVSVKQVIEGEMPEQELEEVMVTASRTEMPLSQTAKVVTVITREDIQRAPVHSVEDMLVYVANIDVIQRGGHGVQSDISIRGGSADQTAVLLNGVNLSNPHTGHYSFDFPINLSDIERIEILQGPSALIYGSNAFSGGINIITKKETDTKIQAHLNGGMHRLAEVEVRGAEAIGRTANSLSAGYRRSDGYIDNSDYSIFNALWQTRLQTGEASRIDLMAGYNNKSYGANTFYSATYPEQYDRTSEIAGAINGSFGRRLKFVPQLYWSRHFDRFDLIKNTETGRNHHRGDTYGANLMFRYSSSLGDTHFGGELRQEDILSSKLGKPVNKDHGIYTNYDERTQTNLVLEHTVNLQRFVFSAGVLGNYNTLQNDRFRFYPSASIAYRPVNYMKVFTTWSRSGRLPTFTDLYYTTETHNANETLQTETSESFDLGVNYRHAYFTLTLTGYLMKGRNMIDWVREQGQEKWSSWNHTEVDKQGLEIDLQAPLSFLGSSSSIKLNYARMYQDCDSRGLESRYTLNYLRDKLTARLNHDIVGGLTASWNFRFQNRMGTFRKYEGKTDLGLQPYPPFSTLDLRLNYLYKHFAYHLDFNNIFDNGYFDIGNVPQAGFWLTGGIKYEF